ncbi:MAG: ion transporter [Spirochaetales bacterium]
MRSRLVIISERIVLAAVVLFLVQSLFEDLSVLLDWSRPMRLRLLVAAFVFDLFFTVEFLCRFYFAFVDGRASHYVFKERGWIDFIASVPLLLFSSGPTLFAIAAGGVPLSGMARLLNFRPVAHAIRVARILRLLRVIKIVQYMKHLDSTMAQRHVSRITTLAVSVVVLVSLGFGIVDAVADLPTPDSEYRDATLAVAEFLEEGDFAAEERGENLDRLAQQMPQILVVREGNQTRYSRFDDSYYREYFGPSDYTYLTEGDVSVFVDLRPLNRAQAGQGLLYFVLIVSMAFAFLFIYGPHFAATVSNPVRIMDRGMRERNYNLQVQVREQLRDDEVFSLADAYNTHFLPLKDRQSPEETQMSDIELDTADDLFDAPDDNV